MTRAIFVLFFILFSVRAAPAAEAWQEAPSRDIWIGIRSDGAKGSGTQHDPFDGSTAAKMSAILHNYAKNQVPNITVHLGAGVFPTSGRTDDWGPGTGWTIAGAGEGRTIIKIDPHSVTYTGPTKQADPRSGLFEVGKGHITVQNLTIDGSATDFGTALTAPFTMPAARDWNGVVVPVADAQRFERAIGRWVLIEQPPQSSTGMATDYAMMQVVAVPDGRHLRLMNPAITEGGTVTGELTAGSPVVTNVSSMANLDQGQAISSPGNLPDTRILTVDSAGQITLWAKAQTSGTATLSYSPAYLPGKFHTNVAPMGNMPAGTVVPANAYVLLNIHICGLLAGRPGDRIEHVTVENVEQPYYEGPVGINFNGSGSKMGPEAILNCTVKNVWGTCGWVISLSGPTDAEVAGNKVYSNGHADAYSMGGALRLNLHDNYATDVGTGFFSDVTPSSNCRIENNTFIAVRGMQVSGAVILDHCVIANNHITVTTKAGIGIFLLAITTNSVIKGNVISALPEALPGAFGLQCRPNPIKGAMFGDTTVGSPVLTNLSNVAYLQRHTAVTGPGIPDGAEITDLPGAHPFSATLDQAATATASGVALTYGPIVAKNLVADNHVQFGMPSYRCLPKYGVQSGNTVGTDNNGGVKVLDLGLPPAAPGDTSAPPSMSLPPPKLPAAPPVDTP